MGETGLSAPYSLLHRSESPCRLGQLDLAIETASKDNRKAKAGLGNGVVEKRISFTPTSKLVGDPDSPLRCSRKARSSFGRNADFFGLGKKNEQRQLRFACSANNPSFSVKPKRMGHPAGLAPR